MTGLISMFKGFIIFNLALWMILTVWKIKENSYYLFKKKELINKKYISLRIFKKVIVIAHFYNYYPTTILLINFDWTKKCLSMTLDAKNINFYLISVVSVILSFYYLY